MMDELKKFVTYEDFGAVGDGEHDDMEAIVAAHAYANAHKLPVKTKWDAHYYIGPKAITAVIETDVDWNTSRFTIDDRAVEDRTVPCFIVKTTLAAQEIKIDKLTCDTKQLDIHPEHDCHVTVYNDNVRHYIRLGLNVNNGQAAQDTFVLKKDGSIYGMLDWDHENVTSVETYPIDDDELTLRGGVFTTIANCEESQYNYYARGIMVNRSRVTVDGLVHHIAGEISHGAPYRGILIIEKCAFIKLKDCFFTGHKTYWTIGAAGLPVPMGSYDIVINSVVDLHITNCRVNGITDRTRWGVIGTNFCKNIVLEDCEFSRLDAHMGVSGEYTIRRCKLGHQGLNAIGHGLMTVEDSTVYGDSLICFRTDYGSIWRGDVVVKNCKWVPACGEECSPKLFMITNAGMHDFGYPCSMPTTFTVENLYVEDSHTPADYAGLELFTDPDAPVDGADFVISEPRPYPYAPSKAVTVSGLATYSGKPVRIGVARKLLENALITVNGVQLHE